MAMNTKEYTKKIDTGLKATKDYKKFFYRFKIDGKTCKGYIDYTKKNWTKGDCIKYAKNKLFEIKEKKTNDVNLEFTENSTLDAVATLYFDMVCSKSLWNKEKRDMYNNYLGDIRTDKEKKQYKISSRKFHNPHYKIGKKKIKDIKLIHINAITKGMQKQGHSKQTINGCSSRTIKKLLIQILKPILMYAVDNGAIEKIPKIEPPKPTRAKKTVKNPVEKINTLHRTIALLYKDTPFYRALFYFALYGRRWNEIRTLRWSDIDFLDNTYTIRAENNKISEEQTYDLPVVIAEALSLMQVNKRGIVFKSPITGKELYSPKKQLSKIKAHSQIEELTMHYFRHILVSAMGEQGLASTVLSASLGHVNLDTVNQYYLSASHTTASQTANKAIEGIIND